MKRALTLASIAEIDAGQVAIALDKTIAAAVADCIERPAVKAARVVILELAISPKQDERANLENCETQFTIKSKGPARQSRVYTMDYTKDGRLTFHPDFPNEPNANGLFDQPPDGQGDKE